MRSLGREGANRLNVGRFDLSPKHKKKAQQMAAHESPRTTKLYDRRSDVVSLDEVEKVVF